MYKAIIFDFFDVIHSDPFLGWLKKYGYKPEGGFEASSRKVDLGHISELEFYQELSKLSGQSLKSVQAVFGKTHLIDTKTVRVIERLRKHYKVGLLSNSSGEYLRPILKKHNTSQLFDEIVISAEVGLIKPTTEIFDFILNKMKVTPAETIFIDDNQDNVEAAKLLGITSFVYTDPGSLKKQLSELGVRL